MARGHPLGLCCLGVQAAGSEPLKDPWAPQAPVAPALHWGPEAPADHWVREALQVQFLLESRGPPESPCCLKAPRALTAPLVLADQEPLRRRVLQKGLALQRDPEGPQVLAVPEVQTNRQGLQGPRDPRPRRDLWTRAVQ